MFKKQDVSKKLLMISNYYVIYSKIIFSYFKEYQLLSIKKHPEFLVKSVIILRKLLYLSSLIAGLKT